jgi:hypothetical protein
MKIFWKLITLIAGFFISLFSLVYVADGYGWKSWVFLVIGIFIFYTGTRISK